MQASYSIYDFKESIRRIDEILNGSEASYEETDSIPDREKLTFTNGYYVSASALCVDIRNSMSLSDKYAKPKLAKIYRSYISEVVAVLKGDSNVNEIYIEGDGVWAVFNTPFQPDLDGVFSTSADVSSLIDVLNNRFSMHQIDPITVGIGLTYAQALYIKAGYKGSGINEVVWLGKLVSDAHTLCSYGNRTWSDKRTMVSSVFYQNLNEHNRGLLTWNAARDCYHGYFVNTKMENWLKS